MKQPLVRFSSDGTDRSYELFEGLLQRFLPHYSFELRFTDSGSPVLFVDGGLGHREIATGYEDIQSYLKGGERNKVLSVIQTRYRD